MQTAFSKEQLDQPEIAEADQILRTCVHYGFCTGTCPTYVLFRDENDSPRGRIDLIHEMLKKGGRPDPKTVHHLDRCLSCMSCMSTCAVKVDYIHLLDVARDYIEKHFKRPLGDRLLRALLAGILPYPKRFSAALALAKVGQGLAKWLPGRLGGMLELAGSSSARPDLLKPQTFPAQGKRVMRVALLAGCAQQALDRNVNAATIRVLQRHGCDVVVADGAGCCGALPLHMGFKDQAQRLARANVTAWGKLLNEGLDAVVVNASGCGTTVKDYGHLIGTDEANRIGSLCLDITELLSRLDLRVIQKLPSHRVAYHDACSLQHGQKITKPPRQLLRKVGFTTVDVPEKHFCCGSAGTYNLLQPSVASVLGQRKASHVDSVNADIVAAGNLGCMVQLGRYAETPIVHTVELIDWATGGPMPEALAGRVMRKPAPVDEGDAAIAFATSPGGSKSDDPVVW